MKKQTIFLMALMTYSTTFLDASTYKTPWNLQQKLKFGSFLAKTPVKEPIDPIQGFSDSGWFGYHPQATAIALTDKERIEISRRLYALTKPDRKCAYNFIPKDILVNQYYWSDDDLQAIINKGADVNAKNSLNGETLLHIKVGRTWRLQTIQILLNNKADVNAKNQHGQTPLHRACQRPDFPSLMKLLIEKGANVNAKNNYGQTPLHIACQREGQSSDVIHLLIQEGADVNAIDDSNCTPLRYACGYKHFDLAKILVENGAEELSTMYHNWALGKHGCLK